MNLPLKNSMKQSIATNRNLKGLEVVLKIQLSSKSTIFKKNPSWFLKEDSDIYKAYIPKFPYKILFTFNTEFITI